MDLYLLGNISKLRNCNVKKREKKMIHFQEPSVPLDNQSGYIVDDKHCVSHGYVGNDDGYVPIYQNSETPLNADDAHVNQYFASNGPFDYGITEADRKGLNGEPMMVGGYGDNIDPVTSHNNVYYGNEYQGHEHYVGDIYPQHGNDSYGEAYTPIRKYRKTDEEDIIHALFGINTDDSCQSPHSSYSEALSPSSTSSQDTFDPYTDVYPMFNGVESPSRDVSTYSNLSTFASQTKEDYGLRSFDERLVIYSPNEMSDQSSDYERTTEDDAEQENYVITHEEQRIGDHINYGMMTNEDDIMIFQDKYSQYMNENNKKHEMNHNIVNSKKRKFDSSYLHISSFENNDVSAIALLQRVNMIPIQSDGFKWRKYGQKTVKGSEFPRNYFKCSTYKCPAKKHVERYVDSEGLLREKIKYINEHTHLAPNSSTVYIGTQKELKEAILAHAVPVKELPKKESDFVSTKLVVECNGYIDHSNDGYSWRKYGQKNVKGLFKPRQYYRCTFKECGVKKQVESITPVKTVITYDGRHNHDSDIMKETYIYIEGKSKNEKKK